MLKSISPISILVSSRRIGDPWYSLQTKPTGSKSPKWKFCLVLFWCHAHSCTFSDKKFHCSLQGSCSDVAKKNVARAYLLKTCASPDFPPDSVPCAWVGRRPVVGSFLSINLDETWSLQTIHFNALCWGDVVFWRASGEVMLETSDLAWS